MKSSTRIVLIASLIAILILSGISIWKWNHFQFNTLDLAIYTQVAWNTGHGNILESTIQNSNYFGDHIEPYIFLLAYLFHVVPHALLLIIVQIVIVFGSTFLVLKLAQRYCSDRIALACALAYCLNPVTWNIANTEFHLISFAIPLILWALLAFARKKYSHFLVSLLLLLFVREDASLAVFGIGLLGLVEKRNWKWWAVPCGAAIAWFGIAIRLTEFFAPNGYKFTVYYQWLGNSFGDMITTIITRPWYALGGLLHVNNILLLAALLLLFLGLPLFGKRSLVVCIPALIQLLLGRFNPELLIETHYLSLMLPLGFFVSIVGLSHLAKKDLKFVKKIHATLPSLPAVIIFVILIYSFLFLGPVIGTVQAIANSASTEQERALISSIPDEASVVASYGPLPNLATRSALFSLHYAALGHRQFSTIAYDLSPAPDYIVLDLTDLTTFELQYASPDFSKNDYKKMHIRLSELFNQFAIAKKTKNFLLLRRTTNGNSASTLSEKIDNAAQQELIPLGPVSIISHAKDAGSDLGNTLVLTLRVNALTADSTKGFEIVINDPAKTTSKISVPFGWNLTPLFSLQENDVVRMRIPLTQDFFELPQLTLTLNEREGYAGLNGIGGASNYITRQTERGKAILNF